MWTLINAVVAFIIGFGLGSVAGMVPVWAGWVTSDAAILLTTGSIAVTVSCVISATVYGVLEDIRSWS
jgi:hypothetical protein